MIPDSKTNLLYLADSLPVKQPKFFKRFTKVLNESAIEYKLLPGTKDIWAIDYMPVQVEQNEFVQFTYNSAYLHDLKLLHTVSDVDRICRAIHISPIKSKIVLDGGNVVKGLGKAIISNIVFKDNPQIEKNHLIRKLENKLQVEQIIFIPWDESDCTGHADGMVRFLDKDTVLINDWSGEPIEFQNSFEMSLHNA
jgi:agmatine deiminase